MMNKCECGHDRAFHRCDWSNHSGWYDCANSTCNCKIFREVNPRGNRK